MPYLLAFAAGAMLYVVIEEIIPESQNTEKKDLMAFITIIGRDNFHRKIYLNAKNDYVDRNK